MSQYPPVWFWFAFYGGVISIIWVGGTVLYWAVGVGQGFEITLVGLFIEHFKLIGWYLNALAHQVW